MSSGTLDCFRFLGRLERVNRIKGFSKIVFTVVLGCFNLSEVVFLS